MNIFSSIGTMKVCYYFTKEAQKLKRIVQFIGISGICECRINYTDDQVKGSVKIQPLFVQNHITVMFYASVRASLQCVFYHSYQVLT